MSSALVRDLLEALDKLAGGLHPGFRPVHARGTMYSGSFTPSPDAARLTRAPQAVHPSTPVTVRFSVAAGIPSVADNDPMGSSPQAMAVRFHLADHIHTDIIAQSLNAFPARTGEEFLEFLQAAAASGPGSPTPPPIVAFLAAHPAAKAFVGAPKPLPTSYARQAYFAITAFKFTNSAGQSQFGRFRLRPEARTEFLTPEEAAGKTADFLTAELSERLAKGPARFRVLFQLAEAGGRRHRLDCPLAGDPAGGGVRQPRDHGARGRAGPGAAVNHFRPSPAGGRDRLGRRPADHSAVGDIPSERPAVTSRRGEMT
jgi:catalase